MSRWVWFSICAILGLLMLICGLLVPAHLRAVDASIIQQAGRNTPSLIEAGLALAQEKKLGAAQLLLQAAQASGLPGQDKLGRVSDDLAIQHPTLLALGGAEPNLEQLVKASAKPTNSTPETFTEFVVRSENRDKVLGLLRASPSSAVQELLRTRALTNTVIFSPSQSASGQAFDAAVSVCGLLAEGGHLTTGLSNAVIAQASDANHGGNSQLLEQMLLDLMSLGQRVNWGQLMVFVAKIEDAETLRLLANHVRNGHSLPVLFSAVQLSGDPGSVARYLMNFSKTGLADLGESLRFGAGGVKELLRRNQQMHRSDFGQKLSAHAPFSVFLSLASDYSLRMPSFALTVKWVLYLVAGFFIAAALHYVRPAVSALERPLQVRGFHVAREFLFALGFLFVVLLLSEPFLAQDSQKADMPFRLRLPMVGDAGQTGSAIATLSFMNQTKLNLLTMLLFFVIQGLLYTACLVKLAEIRRQQVPPRTKLKLLENEEHLFDAGLYLGFLGTIVSFVVYSLWAAHQFSLMVAYSSTSFGIIFVSLFKICHLRALRRKLLLEAEAEAEAVYPEQSVPASTPSLAASL